MGGDTNSYVRRAAVAAICEPRLLTDPATRAAALQACRKASESIAMLPATERKTPGLRNLRQALGYCWSVAVAADPDAAMPAFEGLRAVDDPDIRWIVASNLKKSRLRRHLERWPQSGQTHGLQTMSPASKLSPTRSASKASLTWSNSLPNVQTGSRPSRQVRETGRL